MKEAPLIVGELLAMEGEEVSGCSDASWNIQHSQSPFSSNTGKRQRVESFKGKEKSGLGWGVRVGAAWTKDAEEPEGGENNDTNVQKRNFPQQTSPYVYENKMDRVDASQVVTL